LFIKRYLIKIPAVIFATIFLTIAFAAPSYAVDVNDTGSNSGQKVESLSKFYQVPGEEKGEFKKDPVDLLPAWRYGFTGDLHSSVPTSNFAQRVMSLFGTIFLWMSASVWSILLFILKYSLTLDLANSAAQAINSGFKGLSDMLSGSGLILVLAAFALFAVVRYALTASFGKIARVIAGFLIPVALLQGLTTAAGGTTDANQIPKGSPAWLASETSAIVDQFGASLGQGFGLLPGARLGSYAKLSSTESPNCMAYYQTLYNQYDAYGTPVTAADVAGKNMTPEQRSAFTTGSGQLKTLSRLWERAWLSTFASAQFGDTGSGSKIICHKLEDSVKIAQDEQRAIADASQGYPISASTTLFNYKGGTEHEAQMMGWAACKVENGKMVPTTGWKEISGMTATDCENWFKTGVADKLKWNNTGVWLTGWFGSSGGDKVQSAVEKARSGADPELRASVDDALDTITNFKGEKAGRALVAGFIAFLLSLIYLWVLGTLGLGAILAQLGMILTLVLLPGTLLLLAIPNGAGKGPGQKLLKLTIAFTFAKLVFTTIIVMIMQAIAMFEQLLPTSLAMGGLSYALAPLASIFLVKFILKQIGLGDITTLAGSLGMASGGAFAASGDKNGKGMFSAKGAASASKLTGALGNKLGTQKADAAARKIHKGIRRAPFAPARALDRKAKISERSKLEYDARKTDLLGRKDADGNLVEYGLAHQLSSMAGIIGMAQGSKLLGKATNSDKPLGKALDWAANTDPKKASRAKLMAGQRAERKANLSQERFKTKEERLTMRKDRSNARLESISAISQLGEGEEIARNSLGEIERDSEGKTMIRGRDGTLRSTGDIFNDDAALLAMGSSFMEKFEVTPEQFTMGKNSGIGPTIIPQGRDTNGRLKLVKAKSEEASILLAQSNPNMFIEGANHRPVGMSDDAFAMFQWNLQIASGLRDENTGEVVDVMKEFGVDVNTEEGRTEFRKALAGGESRMDRIKVEVSPHSYMGALASAREYDSKSGLGSVARDTRLEVTSKKATESFKTINGKSSFVQQVVNETTEGSNRFIVAVNESSEVEKELAAFNSSNTIDIEADNYARNRIKKLDRKLEKHSNGEIVLDTESLQEIQKEREIHLTTRSKVGELRVIQENLLLKRNEAESKVRVEMESILSNVDNLGVTVAEVERQTAFMEFSRDLIDQDNGTGDIGVVISAADKFDKNYPAMQNDKENIVINASANLVMSLERGAEARKAAINGFMKETIKLAKSATDRAATASNIYARISEEAATEERRVFAERIRQGLERKVDLLPKETVSNEELRGWRV